jgi:prevent-host-death family protein
MDTASIAEVATHLTEFIARAEAGEVITITRDGQPVAQLVPSARAHTPLDIGAMRALTESMATAGTGAVDLVRRLRDEERY